MRLRIVTASLLIIFCAVLEVCTAHAQETNTSKVSKPESTSPIVNAWEPKTGSVDSLIYLSGYRLYAGEWNKTKAVFIQNGVEIPAQTGGGSKTLNNLANGPQTLVVIISEELVPGQAQIVVEFDGHRSNPATITVTEWKLPIIKSLNPTSGAPGTLVEIECEGFHISDEVEATDAEGKLIRIGGGGSSRGTAFGIPEDLPEGPVTVRIGNRKYGKGQLTEPLTFTVTNEPRTVDVWPSEMQVVAPGQWLDLQVSNIEPLKRSERTEVSFKQAEQTIIVASQKP